MIKYEEKTQTLEDACNYFKEVATRRIEPGPEKLKEVLALIEERFLGGYAHCSHFSGPRWDESNKELVIRAMLAADEELSLWDKIRNGTPPATVEYPRPGIGEVAGGTLLGALKTRGEGAGCFSRCAKDVSWTWRGSPTC